ncbi:alpha-crystallin A chain [Folsomia candida]|nr:alpha-crystallin A chain [Folsomia candida]
MSRSYSLSHHFPQNVETYEPVYPRRSIPPATGRTLPAEEIGIANITRFKDRFSVKLDIHLFRPDDISVKTLDDFVIVEGHHSSQDDDVVRSFERRIQLPKGALVDDLTSDVGCDGYLIINVPVAQ